MTTPPSRECALPGTPLAGAAAGLDACVHCGFCLQACPTYVNLEDENDSPRGRIVLMRRLLEGELPLDDEDVNTHLDRCLGCRACETACPSGVPYGHLLEATRATTLLARRTPFIGSVILAVFQRKPLLAAVLLGARVFRATGLPSLLANVLPKRMAFPMAMLASTKPNRQLAALKRGAVHSNRVKSNSPRQFESAETHSTPRQSAGDDAAAPRKTVALLEGCVMRGLFPHTNAATARVLTYNKFDVTTVPNQSCCGALHAHAGKLETARELARINVAAFENANIEYIAINSAGCGAMVKEYGSLLQNDTAWSARAKNISAKARDITELLSATGPVTGAPVDARVTYDAPCHLMHAQRITREPLNVLHAIPALKLVPLTDTDQCCGSAGIYNLIEPETSDAVLAPKLRHIAATNAALVATGNPGCLMQIGAGLLLSGSATRAVHPIDLLDASYGNPA